MAGPATKLADDFTVSAIGFGAGALAAYGEADDAESLATLNRCLDLGVTFIDTADVYGGGSNERLIAKLLAGRRDEVTLATKFGVGSDPADRAAGRPPVRGDAAYVRQCIDESLARLQTDVVDLYGGSVILNSSSPDAKDTDGVYPAAVAALRSVARTWASELRDRKIRVNVISPDATEVATAAVLLAADRKDERLR
jgi:predicted aldo/keto reductase-like oxidoreductase